MQKSENASKRSATSEKLHFTDSSSFWQRVNGVETCGSDEASDGEKKRKLKFKSDASYSLVDIQIFVRVFRELVKSNIGYESDDFRVFSLSLSSWPQSSEIQSTSSASQDSTEEDSVNVDTDKVVQKKYSATVFDNVNPIDETSNFDPNSIVLCIAPSTVRRPQPLYEENIKFRAFPFFSRLSLLDTPRAN